MNCEPGDLARVVNQPETRLVGLVDVIVRVTALVQSREGELAWNFEGKPFRCRCKPGCNEFFDCIPDVLLRPLRDPGPNAVDEVLQRLGVPEAETA